MPTSHDDIIRGEVTDILDELVSEVRASAPFEDTIGELSVEHAFDFDGCLGEEVPEDLEADDLLFWSELKREMHEQTKGLPRERRCISIATNRQSKACDDWASYVNEGPSCFPLYVERAEFLDVDLDFFLLPDVKHNLPSGTSFRRIMDTDYDGEHVGWAFDHSKISLIYAKIHRAAMCNPHGEVAFTFYDDRSDILDGLYAFFDANKALLPDNLVLKLCQYTRVDGILYRYEPLSGKDSEASLGIDYAYKKTTQKLGDYIEGIAVQRATVFQEKFRSLELDDIHALELQNIIRQLRADEHAVIARPAVLPVFPQNMGLWGIPEDNLDASDSEDEEESHEPVMF
ncbi:MAG: hypothetical protein K0U24_04590 [Gammaproteobacteria bacterium]|nr:hypothetical protein [Gammaproteobacteria bacterium]